jgi:hypothetical protein
MMLGEDYLINNYREANIQKLLRIEKQKGFQKILFKMPLRAERLSVESIKELADLYDTSFVTRRIWKKTVDSEGILHRVPTEYYVKTIDPLTSNYHSLYSFFSEDSQQKRFLLGRKGTGKTFNTLLALNKSIRQNKNLIRPCYISFDLNQKVVYIKNPLSYATKEQWLEGKIELIEFDSFEKYIEWSNCIIFDEIHYLLEYIIETGKSIDPFINLMNKIFEKNCKIMLISEDILMSYAEKLQDKRFDELCLKFGLYPNMNSSENNYVDNVNYDPLALRELRSLDEHQLSMLNDIYGFDIDSIVLKFLANAGCTARGFFKIMKTVDWKLNKDTFSKLLCSSPFAKDVELRWVKDLINALDYQRPNILMDDVISLDSFINIVIRYWCRQ